LPQQPAPPHIRESFMRKTCLLIGLLMLLGLSAACMEPRQCNYARPDASFNDDHYKCQMLAETKRMGSNDPNRHYNFGAQWVSDCMAQLGWHACR
jgi:hypothetical protein